MSSLAYFLCFFLSFAYSLTCPGTGTSSCDPGLPPNVQIAPGASLTIPLNFATACIPSQVSLNASVGLHITGDVKSCTLTADASFSGTGSISISWCDLSGNPGTSTTTCQCLCGSTTGGPTTTGAPATPTPTTGAPTTGAPTTGAPTTGAPTTGAPTTGAPTTGAPTTGGPTTGAPTTGAPATTPIPTSTTACQNGPPSTCAVNIPTQISFCGCEKQKSFIFMFPSCNIVAYNVSYGVDAGITASVTRSTNSCNVTISAQAQVTGSAWILVEWCDSKGGHGVQNTTCYVYPQQNSTTPAPTSVYRPYLSGNKPNNNYGQRNTNMQSINIPGLASGLYYYSIDQSAGRSDGMFGACYQSNGPLVSFLTYFNVSSDWSMGLNPATADTSKAVSLIGSCYLGLAEVTGNIQNYTTLQEIHFKDMQWTVNSVNSESGMQYATFTGTEAIHANFIVTITFVIANQGCSLSTGAQLSPKSVEAVINIQNYPFTSTKSSLVLLIGVGTAAIGNVTGLMQVEGYHRMVAGNGDGGVYWDGSSQCITNAKGDTTNVGISVMDVNSSMMEGAGFVSQCQSLKQAQAAMNVNFTIISIMMPQSNNLTYDPSVGVGAFPNGTVVGMGNVASLLHPHFAATLMISLLLSLTTFFW